MTRRGFFATLTSLAVAVSLVLMSGCGEKTKPANGRGPGGEEVEAPPLNVLIGVLLPLSGERKSEGEAVLAGLKHAVRVRGAAVGLHESALRVEDYGDVPDDLVSDAANLIESDEVAAIVGPVEPIRVRAVEALAKRYKVPVLTPASEPLALQPVGSTVWRLTFDDVQEGRAMAEFAVQKGYRKIAIMDDSDLPASILRGSAFYTRVVELAGEQGITRIAYDETMTDYRRTVALAAFGKEGTPDAFYITGRREEAAAIVRQMRVMNVLGAIIGSTDWKTSLGFPVEVAPGASVFAPTRFFADRGDAVTIDFVKTFRQKIGRDPGLLDALGYDAGLVLMDALSRARDAQGSLARDVSAVNMLSGVTGRLSAGTNGFATAVTVLRLKGKTFEFEADVPIK